MIKDIDKTLTDYFKKWHKATSSQTDIQSFIPTAVGWKVADEKEYKQHYEELRPLCDKTVETWMNNRWIAKLHLKDMSVEGGITIIKLMQRRPGADDALGLDHVDFLCRDIQEVEMRLVAQNKLKWSWENNDVVAGYDWISIWFDGTEAKIKQDTVIDIVIEELYEVNKAIKSAGQ